MPNYLFRVSGRFDCGLDIFILAWRENTFIVARADSLAVVSLLVVSMGTPKDRLWESDMSNIEEGSYAR